MSGVCILASTCLAMYSTLFLGPLQPCAQCTHAMHSATYVLTVTTYLCRTAKLTLSPSKHLMAAVYCAAAFRNCCDLNSWLPASLRSSEFLFAVMPSNTCDETDSATRYDYCAPGDSMAQPIGSMAELATTWPAVHTGLLADQQRLRLDAEDSCRVCACLRVKALTAGEIGRLCFTTASRKVKPGQLRWCNRTCQTCIYSRDITVMTR
jgi:hypothetical protein